MKDARNSYIHGFTLIEIIVSLALFAVVAVVAIGAFLKIVDANRRAEAIESAVNDTNFALESMVRDLRVGSDYQCLPASTPPGSPPTSISHTSAGLETCSLSPGSMIAFNSSVTDPNNSSCNLVHAYELANSGSGNVLEKAEQQSCGASYSFVPLTSTSSDLTIQTFDIAVNGDWPPANPEAQPKVFILISGMAGASQEDQTSFTVQTTASQRIMEY